MTDDRAAERWAWVAWGALVAIAVAVFEAFQQPALLGATVSLKFAWTDARTGWWLWGRDLIRGRGRAHFWTYLGYGLWKAALVGIGLTLVFSVVLAQVKNPKPPGANANGGVDMLALVLTGSCLSGVFASLLAAVVTLIGLAGALAGGHRLWLNSALATARVCDHWPPDYGENNRLRLVALPSALIVVGLGTTAVVVLVIAVVEPAGRAKDVMAGGGVFTAFLGVPVLSLFLNDLVKRRLTASSTLEAWPDESGEGG